MRKISSRTNGASYKVLITYYKAAIRSIIEYCYPAIILMSKTRCLEVDKYQHRALRTATRSYSWVSGVSLERITNTEPLHGRKHKALLKLADKTLRDPTHPNHDTFICLLNNQTTSVNPTCWNNVILQMWRNARILVGDKTVKLKVPSVNAPVYRAPWDMNNVSFTMETPENKKADTHPALLKSHALELISINHCPQDVIIYTDGSLNPRTGRAGCGVYIRLGFRTILKSFRVGNHASSLQTELLGIDIALTLTLQHFPNHNVLLLSDSLGALQTIQNTHIHDNLEIVNSIRDSMTQLSRIHFIWIPSHVGIKGNEKADN